MKLNEQPDQDEHQLEDATGDTGRAGKVASAAGYRDRVKDKTANTLQH